MNTSLRLRLAAFATAALSTLGTLAPLAAQASTFGQTEVSEDKVIAIAAPVGSTRHQLLVLEQVSSRRPCWKETGANPVEVDPLLLNFDFSGICGRATDSNGYSIRLAGQDLGMQYALRVVRNGDDLVLMGVPFGRRNAPQLEIARANGVTSGFAKLELNPGWDFAKRNYKGRTLGHFYFTNEQTLSELAASSTTASRPAPSPTPTETPATEVSEVSAKDQLNLSEEQEREIAAIQQRYTARIAAQTHKLREAQEELRQMMGEDTSKRSLRRQYNRVSDLQEDLSELQFEGTMALREVLTSEQLGPFAQLLETSGNLDNHGGQLVGSRK